MSWILSAAGLRSGTEKRSCRLAVVGLAEAAFGNEAPKRLVVAGGVAANQALRARLTEVAHAAGYSLHVPPVALCGDNGAMIAWAGAERLARGMIDARGIVARARWPLDAEAKAVLGTGRLGAKA